MAMAISSKLWDSSILQSYGISVADNDNATTRLEPVQCPHCQDQSALSNYCFSCGERLTDIVIDTDEGIQQSVHNNPDILAAAD